MTKSICYSENFSLKQVQPIIKSVQRLYTQNAYRAISPKSIKIYSQADKSKATDTIEVHPATPPTIFFNK